MNRQWEGGKGDKSRVKNIDNYNANYDKIFRKPVKPSYSMSKYSKYCLFLDDFRNPKNAYLYDSDCSMLSASSTYAFDWDVVRSYKAFCTAIDNRGIPEMVSLDNDLNETHMQGYINATQGGVYEWQNYKETGIHCTIYLINKCKEVGVPFPKYWTHSANHFARKIMRDMIEEYNASLKTNAQ